MILLNYLEYLPHLILEPWDNTSNIYINSTVNFQEWSEQITVINKSKVVGKLDVYTHKYSLGIYGSY